MRVQLSDEQVEQLRQYALKQWVSDDVVDLLADAVREQLPPPIKVGDKVRCGGHGERGEVVEVLALHADSAWLLYAEGYHLTAPVSALERVEEGE